MIRRSCRPSHHNTSSAYPIWVVFILPCSDFERLVWWGSHLVGKFNFVFVQVKALKYVWRKLRYVSQFKCLWKTCGLKKRSPITLAQTFTPSPCWNIISLITCGFSSAHMWILWNLKITCLVKSALFSPQNFLKKPLIFAQYPSSEENGKSLTWWHSLWVAGPEP